MVLYFFMKHSTVKGGRELRSEDLHAVNADSYNSAGIHCQREQDGRVSLGRSQNLVLFFSNIFCVIHSRSGWSESQTAKS
jgi:hypothetical protein